MTAFSVAGPRLHCHDRAPTWFLSLVITAALLAGQMGTADAGQSHEVTWQEAERQLDHLLLTQPPRGFSLDPHLSGPVDHEVLGDLAAGYSRVFVSHHEPAAILMLTLWDPRPGVGSTGFVFAMLSATSEGAEVFDAKSIHPEASGLRESFRLDGEEWEAYSVFLQHGGLVIHAVHEAPTTLARASIEARLRELVADQRARPTVAEPTVSVPPEAAYLDELILDDPGEAPGGNQLFLLPRTSGLVTPLLYAHLINDESLLNWLGELSGIARGYRRHWANPVAGVDLVIELFDLGNDEAHTPPSVPDGALAIPPACGVERDGIRSTHRLHSRRASEFLYPTRRPTRAEPQVTSVIGVFDPYRSD